MTYSDEVLSSYLDGEAEPALAEEIEAAMNADPALVARMEILSSNDALLREAFDDALGETPQRLRAALEPPRSADVLAFKPRPKPAAKREINWPRMAAASIIAVAVAGAIGLTVLEQHPAAPVTAAADGLTPSRALAAALTRTPSGARQPVGGQVLSVALSFRSRDGRLCRQFHLDGAQPADAIACRAGKAWRIEGWMAGRPAAAGGYQTAGGEDAAATAMVDRIGPAQTLDRAGEATAIRSGWK